MVCARMVDMVKESVRPIYWAPDEDCPNCAVCKKPFKRGCPASPLEEQGASSDSREVAHIPVPVAVVVSVAVADTAGELHHCRACGNGVCGACSKTRRPVPSRSWDYAVRVCDLCARRKDPL